MTLAFLSYGIGSITLERFKMVGTIVLVFYTLGLLFEVSAILMMAMSGSGGMGSWHGIIGELAFLVMLVNTVWVWSVYVRKGFDVQVNRWLLNFTKAAYFFWVVAYLLGIVLVIWF